jgi:uncharacterized protein YybS (DUF2232 family)
MSAMETYVIILLCQLVLSRLSVEFPGSFHLATMHIHEKTGFVIAICMFGSYVLKNIVGIDSVYLTYIYILAIMIFAVEGLAFVSYYLIVKGKPRLIAVAFIALLIPLTSSVYVVLGILDIFSDLRGKILYNKNNNE